MRNIAITIALACAAALLTILAVRLRAPIAASSVAAAASASTTTAATASTPTELPPAASSAGVVTVPDALHVYAEDCARRLMRAYVDKYEDDDLRAARLRMFAYDIADAVEEAGVEPPEAWTVTLIFIAHRETILARNPRQVGNEDEGLAAGPWQIHAWKGLDRFKASTALDLLRHAPGAWGLPSPRPWEGLVAQPKLGRPGAVEYLRRYPFST